MSLHHYDPDRHDTQLVAAFERWQGAQRARDALLGAGVPAGTIELVGTERTESLSGGFWESVKRLFAPEDEARRLGKALDQGHVMVVVHPQTVAERETAIEVLEGCMPVDLEERDEPGHAELNHSTMSRADLLSMTPIGDPKYMDSPAAAPEAAAGHLETDSAEPEPRTGTTYTYGIPETAVHGMGAEQQILAQVPDEARPQFVRVVEERMRVGWRDREDRDTRVRSYVADREPQRVKLQEEEISTPTNVGDA